MMEDKGFEAKGLSFAKDTDNNTSMREPNVLGWKMMDRNRETIGWVDNMVIENDTERARYIDVQLDKELAEVENTDYGATGGEGAKEFQPNRAQANILVPIGTLRMDEGEKAVVAEEIDRDTLMQIPRHAPGEALTHEYEKDVRSVVEAHGPSGDEAFQGGEVKPKREVAFKSEHYTKGNENIGSRNPAVRRDVVDEEDMRGEMKNRGDTPPSNPVSNTGEGDAQLGRGELRTEESGATVGTSEKEGMPANQARQRRGEANADPEARDKDFYDDTKYDEDRFYKK